MKNLDWLRIILLVVVIILTSILVHAKFTISDLKEEKYDLEIENKKHERDINSLGQPIVFSTGKDTFVLVKRTMYFDEASFVINKDNPVKIANCVKYYRFVGIYKLPENLSPLDDVGLIVKFKNGKVEKMDIPMCDINHIKKHAENIEEVKGAWNNKLHRGGFQYSGM